MSEELGKPDDPKFTAAVAASDLLAARDLIEDDDAAERHEMGYRVEQLDREWYLVTEAIRREAEHSPIVRAALLEFAGAEVSQQLGHELLALFADNERIQTLLGRGQSRLAEFLGSAEVPDDHIWRLKYDPRAETGDFAPAMALFADRASGVTSKDEELSNVERRALAKKYAYARDVKLLALAESLREFAPGVVSGHETTLANGIRLGLDDGPDVPAELLDPGEWEGRRQIKDRVYEVRVGGERYVLKEQKTLRHADVKGRPFRPKQRALIPAPQFEAGLAAKDEFELAKRLHEEGSRESGRVRLKWERPVAYAQYPDGFQFVVFDYVDNLLDRTDTRGDNEAIRLLTERIGQNPEEFAEEFKIVAARAKELRNHPALADTKEAPSDDAQLSFDEFARSKAIRMVYLAQELYRGCLKELGLYDYDHKWDVVACYVIPQDGRVGLEMIGLDCEYFGLRDDEAERQWAEAFVDHMRNDQTALLRPGPMPSEPRMERAAYLALLEADGKLDAAA